jgi:predicted deacetylase
MHYPIVWSNDDIKPGKARELQNMVDFLDRYGIPGVFFVIPGLGKTLAGDTELLRVIDAARGGGHEFYPHGYEHTPFDHGVPPAMYLIRNEKICRQYDEERLALEMSHTREAQKERLAASLEIWRKTFKENAPGYRAPWCATSLGFYQALADLGLQWSSSSVHGITWHRYSMGDWDAPVEYYDAVPMAPHRVLGGVVEYPMPGDYSPNMDLTDEQRKRYADLCMTDYRHFREHDAPFVLCSHWFSLERDGGAGYRTHALFLPRLLADPGVRFCGMAALHAEVMRGRPLRGEVPSLRCSMSTGQDRDVPDSSRRADQ